ncbi:MAG: T9SS type A sorting domain-containing protein [Candidatus Eisenbacteria bacterium]|nr:T9SS type A sorting domain-containing protein [Candidatus Eisenbacteria bacterium]
MILRNRIPGGRPRARPLGTSHREPSGGEMADPRPQSASLKPTDVRAEHGLQPSRHGRGRDAMPGIIARIRLAAVTVALLCAGSGASAGASVALVASGSTPAPTFELQAASEAGVELCFELSTLEVESYVVEGEAYQTLDIPGGELHGEPGTPALPAFTRLVAIPNRSGVALRVGEITEETLSGMRLLPMQDLEGDAFRIDRDLYAQDRPMGGETVTIGDPLLFRDLRVVPVTVRPLRYNPARGEVHVARRIPLSLDFSGVDLRATRSRARLARTPAVGSLYESLVVNYGWEPDHPRQEAPHLGTWVCIAQDNPTVLSILEPLLEWRRRMGYNVVLATTSETGSSASAIASWLQDAYETWEYPPEFVTIVGDANGGLPIGTFHETWSGCWGEGDHPYVDFTGDPIVPDGFVGRLSASTTSQLELIVNKIVGYERTPYIEDPDWFSRACLVGDPYDSGPTCIQIQQWLKERLLQIGYTEVDTVFDYPFTTQIRTSVNRGVTFYGYRGFWGMSGWDNGDISSLINGWKMCFAINLTCGTGSFEYSTSSNEAWLRAGTPPDEPDGAIGSVATATECTHTRYNNCYYGGYAYGQFWEDHYQLGPATARAKLEMILNYAENEYTQAGRYIYWNNLMGDPATELWTGLPQALQASYPSSVSLGASSVTIGVQDGDSQPVAGAWVYLLQEGQIATGGYTDAGGTVTIPIEATVAGTVLVTVTGHNLHPHLGSFEITQLSQFVGVGGHTIDDDASGSSQGNGDGVINPGEQIELGIALTNFGSQAVHDVELHVTCDDPLVGLLTSAPIEYGTIWSGETVPAPQPVVFRLHTALPADHEVHLELSAKSGAQSWPSILDLPVAAANLVYREHTLSDCGTLLDPGEQARLVVSLRNDGEISAAGPIDLQLISDSYAVRVVDGEGELPLPIAPGNWQANWDDRFRIESPSDCVPGLQAPLRIAIAFADGTADTASFALQVGEADTHDPTGPDAYGYYCYDNTDADYDEAPVYDWIDINPNYGGPGESLGLSDYGWDQDDSRTVDLPFPFTFYGETFDRATICSNGWMSMGSTYLVNYRNWYMPSGNGPARMLAPFWDNLYQQSSGIVCHWYDANNHRYVVAWDNLRNRAGSQYESFELILYDPAYYPTRTGDGVIVFQYETVNNSDWEQMYCTAGIQNAMHTAGLTFSYHNDGPATAASLSAGRAIKFTTGGPGAAGAHGAGTGAATRFLLRQNEPNPFRGGTSIVFGLERAQPVELRVFDVDGRSVRSLVAGTRPAGLQAVHWDGRDARGRAVPAGVYYYRLETGERSAVRRLLRLP